MRVYDGTISEGDTIFAIQEGKTTKGKITKLFSFEGLTRVETKKVCAGDIAIVAGLPDIFIGETLSTSPDTEPLPMIAVDEPTIELTFLINDSPFAGREGKFVTSRQLRSRLEKELEVNVGLKIDFESTSADRFIVRGRGELHIAILLEYMRREGYEMQVSQPQVIFKEEDGKKLEPYEEVTIDTPEIYQGSVIEKLGARGTRMLSMEQKDGHVRLIFDGPTRGLFGYRSQFVIDTKGEGIISTRVIGFRPYAGEIRKRQEGSMISQVTGKVLAYSLDNLQTRGTLYIKENVEVYEGQVIGNTSRGEEMVVNPTKGKNLTNVRSSGTDEAIKLIHPKLLTIENGLELMAGDEYLEITPKSVRLRKQHLTEIGRARSKRS